MGSPGTAAESHATARGSRNRPVISRPGSNGNVGASHSLDSGGFLLGQPVLASALLPTIDHNVRVNDLDQERIRLVAGRVELEVELTILRAVASHTDVGELILDESHERVHQVFHGLDRAELLN